MLQTHLAIGGVKFCIVVNRSTIRRKSVVSAIHASEAIYPSQQLLFLYLQVESEVWTSLDKYNEE